jgi:hypothetical protein
MARVRSPAFAARAVLLLTLLLLVAPAQADVTEAHTQQQRTRSNRNHNKRHSSAVVAAPPAPSTYTVLNDTDFLGAIAYSTGAVEGIDACAAMCLARPDCVATSWNGPSSPQPNKKCNFDCRLSGRRALKGETAAVMVGRGDNRCSTPSPPDPPPPPPPPTPPPPPVPRDWAIRAATGWLLVGTTDPSTSDLCPTIGNGFVAETVCPHVEGDTENTGGTFLSGVYNGHCPTQPKSSSNIRATLPSPHGVVGMANATFVAMALDVQNGTVLRRWRVGGGDGCDVELVQYAHRATRHLIVVTVTATNFGPNGRCTMTPIVPTWPTAAGVCVPDTSNATAGLVSCNSTFVPETTRQEPTVVGLHATAVTETITLTASAPAVAFLAAFATNLEPGVTAATAVAVAKQRWAQASAQSISQLATSHRAAWARLWVPKLDIGGNATMTAALRSSMYYVLSSVRDDWAFGSSPGGLSSTSYSGTRTMIGPLPHASRLFPVLHSCFHHATRLYRRTPRVCTTLGLTNTNVVFFRHAALLFPCARPRVLGHGDVVFPASRSAVPVHCAIHCVLPPPYAPRGAPSCGRDGLRRREIPVAIGCDGRRVQSRSTR